MIFRIPADRINWTTSSFLIGTFFLTLTAVPLYVWYFGIGWFHLALFGVLAAATGFSITLGYHRLFSHMTFRAKLPVRLFTLIFGAAAFENSVLMWASDHRRHHKHVDHDEDPYDITKGFFHAHIGWLLFKLWPEPPLDNVPDLKKDPLIMWQHRHIHVIAVMVSFVLPTLAGFAVGRLGGRIGWFSYWRGGQSCGASTWHIPDQLGLPYHGSSAVFRAMQCARFLFHGSVYVWRGLSQLSP